MLVRIKKFGGYYIMSKMVRGKRYEKAEVTFNAADELDMELYDHVMNKSIIIGKSNYLKQLVYEDYKKSSK